MLGITDFYTFVVGTILVIILPGPNSLYVLSLASRAGVAPAFRAALGILVGDAVLIVASVAGVSTLLLSAPMVYDGLKLLGGAYLIWVGGAWIWDALHSPLHQPANAAAPSAQKTFRNALAISLVNPKAILFFIAFFVQFVDPDYPNPWVSFAILALTLQIISQTYLALLILSASLARQNLRLSDRLRQWLLILAGLLFVAFGLRVSGLLSFI